MAEVEAILLDPLPKVGEAHANLSHPVTRQQEDRLRELIRKTGQKDQSISELAFFEANRKQHLCEVCTLGSSSTGTRLPLSVFSQVIYGEERRGSSHHGLSSREGISNNYNGDQSATEVGFRREIWQFMTTTRTVKYNATIASTMEYR